MTEVRHQADPAPSAPNSWPLPMGIGGPILAVRETTPTDAIYPATVLVLECVGGYTRILVPPEVCRAARELLLPGQWVRVEVNADGWPTVLGARVVATRIQFVGTYH